MDVDTGVSLKRVKSETGSAMEGTWTALMDKVAAKEAVAVNPNLPGGIQAGIISKGVKTQAARDKMVASGKLPLWVKCLGAANFRRWVSGESVTMNSDEKLMYEGLKTTRPRRRRTPKRKAPVRRRRAPAKKK